LAPSSPAADQAGPVATTPVATLIEQLGDRNFRVRQAAGKELEERGEESLPLLRQSSTHADEEIRRRVEVLSQRIERTSLLSAKKFTFRVNNVTIEEAIKELARLSGYKLQFQGGQPRKLSIEMENVTYWQVMEKLCNDAGLSPGYDDQQGIVYLYQQNTISPYTHTSGPFRFVAQNFNYSRYVNLANIPRNGNDQQNQDNNLNFSFLVQAEPKIPLLAVSPPRLTKAVDENGFSLLPRQHDNQGFNVAYYEGNGLYRNFQHSVNAPMAKPDRDATKAAIIKGKVMVTLLSGTKPDVVVENLTTGKKKQSGVGQTGEIDIEDVTEANKNWTITMQIRRRAKDGEQDHNWMNTVPQKLELYDAKGRQYRSNGIVNYLNTTQNSISAVFQFSPPPQGEIGPAVKLVLAQWLTLQHELEFEFKDLPLP